MAHQVGDCKSPAVRREVSSGLALRADGSAPCLGIERCLRYRVAPMRPFERELVRRCTRACRSSDMLSASLVRRSGSSVFAAPPALSREASKLARRHGGRIAGRAAVTTKSTRPVRHAIEVRSPTFLSAEFVSLLRRHDIALVVPDTAGRWPYFEDVTADFVYVRLHGDEELYKSGYSPAAIAHWAKRVRIWSEGSEPRDAVRASDTAAPRRAGRDVYVYFDNDVKVRAPFDALALSRALRLDWQSVVASSASPERS
jgi:uncharacterized protein YecE (DUF72 family)